MPQPKSLPSLSSPSPTSTSPSTSPSPSSPSWRPPPSHSPPPPMAPQATLVKNLSEMTAMLLWILTMIRMVPSSYAFFFGRARTALGCLILLNQIPPPTMTTKGSSLPSLCAKHSKKPSRRAQIRWQKQVRIAWRRKEQLRQRIRRERRKMWVAFSQEWLTVVRLRTSATKKLASSSKTCSLQYLHYASRVSHDSASDKCLEIGAASAVNLHCLDANVRPLRADNPLLCDPL
jgi:hypothetical protein